MSENTFKTRDIMDVIKCKNKTVGYTSKRPALTVINGNNNSKRCNINKDKSSCKSSSLLSETKPELLTDEKFDLSEDKENTQDKENYSLSVSESSEKYINVVENSKGFEESCNNIEKKDFYAENYWYTPYVEDTYAYFKSIEKNYRPNSRYMEKQSDLTENMRSILVDWLVEVGEEYNLHGETLYLAVSYVDRFLSHVSVVRGKMQLVGTASMFIASKFEEINPPELKDFVYITDDTYTKKQILKMEQLILKVLNFDICIPTTYTFLQLFCYVCCVPDAVANLSRYLSELSLLDNDPFLMYLPSAIAAASIALSNYTLGEEMWDESLEEVTGYKLKDLHVIIVCLYKKYSSMSSCPQQAICEKYKSTKFASVSSIEHPKTLKFPEKSYKEH